MNECIPGLTQSTQFSDLLSGIHHSSNTQNFALVAARKHVYHLQLVTMVDWLLTVSSLSQKPCMAAELSMKLMYLYCYSVPCSCWDKSKASEAAYYLSCVPNVLAS